MGTMWDRIKHGLATIRVSANELSAEDRAELEAAEAALAGQSLAYSATLKSALLATSGENASVAANDGAKGAKTSAGGSAGAAEMAAEIARLQSELEESVKAAAAEKAEALLVDFTRSGAVLPAASEHARKLLTRLGEIAAEFTAFLEANGKHVALAENARTDAGTNGATIAQAVAQRGSSDNSALAEMATAYAKEHQVPYAEALAKVATANRALVESSFASLPSL